MLAAALAEPVDGEEQQGENKEGRETADHQAHTAGHGVKETVSIWVGERQTKDGLSAIDIYKTESQ